MRLLFAGTPEFAVPSLDALRASGHELLAVYTQPDRPAGRGRRAHASPVKQRALESGVPVAQPESLRAPAVQAELAAWSADLMVVVAYGLILPRAVLDAPRLGCVNVHASLLPRWRGAAPIQRAILAGDSETGITLMRMAPGLDTGDMLMRQRLTIDPEDTADSLHDRLADLGAAALRQLLPRLASGRIQATPQDDAQATYAAKIDKAEGRIDWSGPAEALARQVRAFNPTPVAWSTLDGERVRIWAGVAAAGGGQAYGSPGEILHAGADGLDVAAGTGVMRVKLLQWPGRRAVTAAEAVNGRSLEGHRFD